LSKTPVFTLKGKRSTECGSLAFVTETDGAIESHLEYNADTPYVRGMDCIWTLKALEDTVVEITPELFSLEENPMYG